jgi:hypothetical protein
MFGDKLVKIVLEFDIKKFLSCFVAFGVQKGLVDP